MRTIIQKIIFLKLSAFLLFSSCQTHLFNQSLSKKSFSYPPHWWAEISDSNSPSWEILPQFAKNNEVILSKRNELGILSNFAKTPFTFHQKQYQSIEGFWQMMLYPDPSLSEDARKSNKLLWQFTRDKVSQMIAFDAKLAGDLAEKNMNALDIDWVSFENKKFKYRSMVKAEHYHIIREAMWQKLMQNEEVKSILLQTGDLILKPDHYGELNAPPEWRYYEIWMEFRTYLQQKPDLKILPGSTT